MSKVQVIGKIQFDPEVRTKKQERQSSWKRTALVILDDDSARYYSWFLSKRFGLFLNSPIRGPHFTIINDRIESEEALERYQEGRNKWNGEEIEFTYDTDVRTDEMSWWLPVESEMAKEIRNDCGLGKMFYGFHMTIGRADHPLMIDHSKYVLRNMLKFNV